jgi:hypothetical protein
MSNSCMRRHPEGTLCYFITAMARAILWTVEAPMEPLLTENAYRLLERVVLSFLTKFDEGRLFDLVDLGLRASCSSHSILVLVTLKKIA